MRHRSRRLTVTDIASLKFTPVENKSGWQSRAEFYAAEQANEEQPLIAAKAAFSKTLAALQPYTKGFWGSSCSDIVTGLQRGDDAAYDPALSVPMGSCSREQAHGAFRAFINQMASTPYTFTEEADGTARLFLFGLWATAKGHDFGTIASWQSAFERLQQLDAFSPEELSFDQSKVKQPEQPKPRNHNEQWSSEVAAIFKRWLDHMATTYSAYLTPHQCDLVRAWWGRNTQANPWRAQDWEEIRRWLVRIGELPATALTADERESLAMENDHLSSQSFADRQALKTRLQRLQQ
jgi:hypothetical protein